MKLASIALSGLIAGRTRLETAASNIVNARSSGTPETAFRPRRTVTESAPDGSGVIARTVPLSPGQTTLFAPDDPSASADGFVTVPDVSLASEAVEMSLAEAQYRASLKLLEIARDLDGALLEATDRKV